MVILITRCHSTVAGVLDTETWSAKLFSFIHKDCLVKVSTRPGQLEALFSRSNKAAALIQLTGSNWAQCHQRFRGRKAQIKHRTLLLRLRLPRRSLRLGIAINPTTTSSEREERWRDWRRSCGGTISAPHLPRFAGSLPETFLAAVPKKNFPLPFQNHFMNNSPQILFTSLVGGWRGSLLLMRQGVIQDLECAMRTKVGSSATTPRELPARPKNNRILSLS